MENALVAKVGGRTSERCTPGGGVMRGGLCSVERRCEAIGNGQTYLDALRFD